MRKSMKMKQICTTLCLLFLALNLTACNTEKQNREASKSEVSSTEMTEEMTEDKAGEAESTRTYQEEQTILAEKQYQGDPKNSENRLHYAQGLFALGNFNQAQKVIDPLVSETNPVPEAIYLSAEIAYLNGDYDQAEEYYQELLDHHNDNFGTQAEYGLQMVYYQTNQFSKAQNLFTNQNDLVNPFLDMMKAFGNETPNQIDWHGKNNTTIPFIITDPMPFIPIEVNGVKMNAFIDTGAPGLVVDRELAEDLGIEETAQSEGDFAGGSTADIGFGKVQSLSLGDVSMKNIPVMLGTFDAWKEDEDFKKVGNVHAIIGIHVLQQFIPTIDYLTGELKLLPRNEVGRNQLKETQKEETIAEKIPFSLAGTHYLNAKGSINNYHDLNLFIDSGFSSVTEGINIPKETMNYAGIPLPKLEQAKNGGMAGNDYMEGIFDVSSYGLGALLVKNGRGLYAENDPINMFDVTGFVTDAMIGHGYLRQYRWTLDFDERDMIFDK